MVLSTPSLLYHACDHLNLYRAELARILDLQCPQVSDPEILEEQLENNGCVARNAMRFLYFFAQLQKTFPQDDIAQVHWLRKHHRRLGTTPLLAMVDEQNLEAVIHCLQQESG